MKYRDFASNLKFKTGMILTNFSVEQMKEELKQTYWNRFERRVVIAEIDGPQLVPYIH